MTKTRKFPFLFASRAGDLESPKERRSFYIWNIAIFLLSSLGITLLSLLLGLGMFTVEFFFDYFRHPLILFLNWIPVILLQLAFFGITGRQWSAFLIASVFVLTASAISFYKLRFRNEPLLFSDIMLISAAAGVAEEFDFTPNVRIVLAAVSIPAGTLFLYSFAKARPTRTIRLIMSLGSVLISALLWFTVYSSDVIYKEKALSEDHLKAKRWNEMVFVTKGSVYPFLYSITYAFETPPEGYTEEEARAILAEYPEAEIPEDRRIDLLVFQLESFCDYTEFGIQGLQPGFYDLYHALESYTGDLIVNIIGGGTIDTERCFLTGSTKLFSYYGPTDSFVRMFRELGYKTFFDHTHSGIFYNRDNINEYLGFESFRNYDNYYMDQVDHLLDHWMSDSFLFPEVIDQYVEHAEQGENVFSFTVTTQGHGGYFKVPYEGPEVFWHVDGASEEAEKEINTYFSKLADTQVQLTAAFDRLRDLPYPVAVLVYGDHQPRLRNSEEFYHLSGLNMIGTDIETMRNTYTVRYLLWVNDAARELLGDDLVGEGPVTSPGFLMDIVFEQLGWRGSPFMQLEREVRQHIQAITINGFYITEEGAVFHLTEKESEMLRKLEYTQFYLKESVQEN